MTNESAAALERLDALIGRWKTEGLTTEPSGASADRIDDGPGAYEPSLGEDDGVLVWTMRSENDRFTGTFNDERNLITGHWDALDDSKWQPWMDITLTREKRVDLDGGDR
jgi:hypothetical protein